jgi:hypothetical protein
MLGRYLNREIAAALNTSAASSPGAGEIVVRGRAPQVDLNPLVEHPLSRRLARGLGVPLYVVERGIEQRS